LSRPEPNDVNDRLAHVNMLVQTGAISAAEGEEARRRILAGL
jgi:argininosuccinate lyase